jgi:uncharacterized protein DUF2252
MKIKMVVGLFTLKVMVQYAEYCGWALARAHAWAGQPALIAGYLGKGDQFDEAVADFAISYAQQMSATTGHWCARSGKAGSKSTPKDKDFVEDRQKE